MELENIKKEKNETRERKGSSKEQYRVVLNKKANESLEGLAREINRDFQFGQISKSDIANWLLERVELKLSPNEIEQIKECHFDESRVLSNLLKSVKETSADLPKELLDALKSHAGLNISKTQRPQRKRPNAGSQNLLK